MTRRLPIRLGLGALTVLALAALALKSSAAPIAETSRARGENLAAATVMTWERAMARQAELDRMPPREDHEAEEEENDEWWEKIPPEDRKYLAHHEYQDPQAIIAARKRYDEFGKMAREAIARGETPPKPWKLTDPTRASEIHALAEPHAPTFNIGWQGLSDGGRPSDSTVTVGPAHVGVMVNSKFAFYTKDGALAVGPVDFAAWWDDAPVPFDLFDPKLVYDNIVGRWILVALNGRSVNPETYFALAISQTNNPEGAWWIYYLRSDVDGSTDTDDWADYPGLGYDSGDATNSSTGGAIYISSNQFSRSGGGFQRGKFRVLPKWQLYNGFGVGWWDFWNSTVFTWKPALTFTSTGASPTEYLINTMSSGATWLTKWTLTNPLGTPSLSSSTIFTSLYGVPPNAEQLGGGDSNLLDTDDSRTQDVQYRNGYLYTTAGDFSFWSDVFDTDAVVHYWKINAVTESVVWDGYFGNNDESFFYGKIQVDANDNATFVFSHSSPSVYARIGMTGRLANDGGVQNYTVIKSGEATYNPSGDSVERWGDYNGLGLDCAGDQAGAWGMSQYAISAGTWQSWIGGTSFGAPNVFHFQDGGSLFNSIAPRWFTWKVRAGDWSGVSLYNQINGDYDLAASNTCPFGTAYQSSTYGVNVRDFIVANGSRYGTDYHHARVIDFNLNDPIGYRIEARNNSRDLLVGSTGTDAFASSEILDLFEVAVTSGKSYAAVVDIQDGGSSDLNLWMFKGSRFNGRRADNDGSAQTPGAGVDETLQFTPTESSTYGFAVVNENFGASDYTFEVWLKPLITDIVNATLGEGSSYTGPLPSLIEGTNPVTWDLVAGPGGMVISSTGVVSWPAATAGVHTVTIRASNPAGSDTEDWQLTVLASTATPTRTSTRTATATATLTLTATLTRTPTPLPSSTVTPSFTAIPTDTATSLPTPVNTSTSTESPSPVPSDTPTEVIVSTATPSFTVPPTASGTASETPTLTPTATKPVSSSPTRTATPSVTAPRTQTPTPTAPVLGEQPGTHWITTIFGLGLALLSLRRRRRLKASE